MLLITINKHPIYNYQELLQQMPELEIQIKSILRQIRSTLKEWNPKQKDFSNVYRSKISSLLEKIQNIQLYNQSTLSLILQNKQIQIQLRRYLYFRLKSSISEVKLIQRYRAQVIKSKETYFFMESNYNILVKEIIQNIKTIEEQTDKLIDSLNVFQQRTNFNQTQDLDTTFIQSLQIDSLLRVVMESTQLQLDNSIDQMFFRLFILDESVSLILQKTEYVLNQITGKLQTSEFICEKAEPASPTKRSALSESLQIFKMKTLKQSKVADQRVEESLKKQQLIKTDYMMQCKPEKLRKNQKLINCCFGFWTNNF